MLDWPSLLVGALLGIPSVALGVLLTFGLASPRIKLDQVLTYTVESNGRRRFRVTYRNRGLLKAIDVRVRARFIIRGKPDTAVPIPVSTGEIFVLGRHKTQTPRLMLEHVDWRTYWPSSPKTLDRNDLEAVMRVLNAYLVVDIVASSQVFQVRTAKRRAYLAHEVIEDGRTRDGGAAT